MKTDTDGDENKTLMKTDTDGDENKNIDENRHGW